MSKDPRVYLAHILECIQKIERFTAGGEVQFLREAIVQDAPGKELVKPNPDQFPADLCFSLPPRRSRT